jgi:hypothetical protein
MKILFLLLTLALSAAGVRGALPSPDLVAQIHFAGAQKISADKNFAAFTNEFCSAEALALRAQTADKLSAWLAGWLQKNLNVTVADGTAKLRPLFDDLQSAEWFLESRAAAGGRAEVALAIKLDASRAQLWTANLKPFFPAATFKQSDGWLIFDSGTGAQNLGDKLAQKISATTTNWLSLDMNWPRLSQWHPQLKQLDLPETAFDVYADAANLLIRGKFYFPENLTLKLDAWQFPSNTMRQPLTSFTATRGFGDWLKTKSWARQFAVPPSANQAFIWTLHGLSFQIFAAVPVPNAAMALQQFNAEIEPVVDERNAQYGFMVPLTLNVTNGLTSLVGMPGMSPYVQAVKEPRGDFLLAGGFPNLVRSQPLPPELFQQLATPGLVYYHWEITGDRIAPQSQLNQFLLMVTRHKQLDGLSAPFKWVFKFAPVLSNTVTEVTQTAPDQFTFKRKAPGGLTAFELLVLANWLEATNFPGCDLRLPPPSDRLKRLRQKNSPVPQFMIVPK